MIVNDIEEFVEDINKNRGIKIYPNPNKGSFILQIEMVKSEDQYNYKIVDISGRIIQSGIINSFEKNKNIEILNPNEGIYFIQIYSPDNYFTSKILIKK